MVSRADTPLLHYLLWIVTDTALDIGLCGTVRIESDNLSGLKINKKLELTFFNPTYFLSSGKIVILGYQEGI